MNTPPHPSLSDLHAIFDQGLLMHYHAGQEIVYEGHAPYGVHVFVKGLVECFGQEGGRRTWQKNIPLFFPVGCDLLLSGKTYDYTLIAAQDVAAYFFSRTLLDQCFALVSNC